MTTVTLVDYGSGNLLSVARALEHCGGAVVQASDAVSIERAERLILPGVGAFADGMRGLRERGLIGPLRRFAASGQPLLGICLGMQMLGSASEEFGLNEGLDIIPGRVVALPTVDALGRAQKTPHIGWSALARPAGVDWADSVLGATKDGDEVYLIHSYQMVPQNSTHLLANCLFGGQSVTAAIRFGNVTGCQFHPEKSGPVGLSILQKFLDS